MRALGEDGLQPAVTAHKLPRTSTELADGRGSRLSYIYQRLHRQVLAAGALDVVGEKAVPFLDTQNRVFGVDGGELLVESGDDRVPARPYPQARLGPWPYAPEDLPETGGELTRVPGHAQRAAHALVRVPTGLGMGTGSLPNLATAAGRSLTRVIRRRALNMPTTTAVIGQCPA